MKTAPPQAKRLRAIIAHTRKSRQDSGLGFQVKVLKTFKVIPSALGNGRKRGGCMRTLPPQAKRLRVCIRQSKPDSGLEVQVQVLRT